MKGYHLTLAVLLAMGLGAGYALLPSDQQIALMYLKSKEFDKAQGYLEKLLNAGDLSIPVVVPLSQIYLSYGDLDRTVQLMGRFVHANPTNVQAYQRLGTFLQYAMRTGEYLANLETLSRLDPSEANLQNLAKIYNFNAQHDKQITVLRTLTERYPDNPTNFIHLAQLLAAHHHYTEGATTLRALWQRHPQAFTLDLAELLVSLLLDNGAPDEAFMTARDWLNPQKILDQVVRLASLIHFRGFPGQGLRLIQDYESSAESHAGVLKELTLLEIANGKSEQAWQRLLRLFDRGTLCSTLHEHLIDLALARGALEVAMSGLRQARIVDLPEWLLTNLSKMAQSNGRRDHVGEIWSRLAREAGYFDAHPVLAATLAMVREDHETALHWVDKAEKSHLNLSQRLQLATLYAALQRKQDALELLSSLVRLPETPDGYLVNLAHLYIHLDRVGEGVTLFDALHATRASAALEDSLTLMFAAQQRETEVIERLSAHPHPSFVFLSDIHSVAMQAKAYRIALHSAGMLAKMDDTSSRPRIMLAHASLKQGDAQGALSMLRPLLSDADAEVEGIYLEALLEARREDEGVRNELRALLVKRLKQEGRPEKEREHEVYLLHQWVGHAEALPWVRQFAVGMGGDWTALYEETLRELNMRRELLTYWKKRLADRTLDRERRRQIGYGLLQEKEKGLATEVFADLAREAPASSPDVAQYLFLLGPRPGSESVAWITRRADRATGKERAGWLHHLLNIGKVAEAQQVVQTEKPSGEQADPILRDAIREVASRSNARERLIPLLATDIDQEQEPERLKRLGKMAEEHTLNALASAAYGRILEQNPHEQHALRRLGLTAFFAGDHPRAVDALNRSIALTGGEYESHFYLAEIYGFQKKANLAREHFIQALDHLDGMSQPLPLNLATTRARILSRLGRVREAIAYYQQLLHQYPKDVALQGDYAELLLAQKEHKQLRQFLAHRAGTMESTQVATE
ncbi:MAG: tetratricopeptide repeat protein [Magnetococcales bacterium]|nr:tetratricopeptide repeat protein [Magnetococcales bacterium]